MLTDMRERAAALSAAMYELYGLETLQQHLGVLQPLYLLGDRNKSDFSNIYHNDLKPMILQLPSYTLHQQPVLKFSSVQCDRQWTTSLQCL